MVVFFIVLYARRTRIRLFSLSILVVAKVSVKVTVSGRLSGTAITMMVIVTIKISRNS